MAEKTYRAGDVIAWDEVPSGTLVRTPGGRFVMRYGGQAQFVKGNDREDEWDAWGTAPDRVTIIATGLSGKETAADLQRLAEVFEIRETWHEFDEVLQAAAERLHAAGWNPGDSAARAADLLAAEDRR
jgi:hypothetical protein